MSFRVTRFQGVWRGVAALVVPVLAAACGSNDTGPPGSSTGAAGADGGSVTAGNPSAGGSASGAGGSGNTEGGASAGQAGLSGSGGQIAGGAGGAGGAAGAAGASGASGEAGSAAGDDVEFRACELGAAIPVVTLNRIDRTSSTCLSITIRQSMAGCTLGLAGNGDWCLARAVVSSDVAACEAQQAPGDAIDAEAATGTFSVALPSPIQIDVDLVFPSGTDFPEMQHVEMTGCAADCQPNDCRQ